MGVEFLYSIGFLVVIIVLMLISKRKRDKMFSSFAQEKGFQYAKKGYRNYLNEFFLGTIGYAKVVSRMIKGNKIEIFDYRYLIANQWPIRQTVAKKYLEKRIPNFTLWQKRWDLIFNKPKLPEVKLNEPNIYAFYGDSKVMEIMNNKVFPYLASRKEIFNIEVRNNTVIIYQIGVQFKDLNMFLETTRKIISLLE